MFNLKSNKLFKVSDFEAVFESLRLSKTGTKSENHFLKVRDFEEHLNFEFKLKKSNNVCITNKINTLQT